MDVPQEREKTSLLLRYTLIGGSAILMACGSSEPGKPELPLSVSPGWTTKGLESTSVPKELPEGSAPTACWKANYAAEGSAEVIVCGYRAGGSAFDALQRVPTTATQVKFQKGRYFVLVRWTGLPSSKMTPLVTAIEKALPNDN